MFLFFLRIIFVMSAPVIESLPTVDLAVQKMYTMKWEHLGNPLSRRFSANDLEISLKEAVHPLLDVAYLGLKGSEVCLWVELPTKNFLSSDRLSEKIVEHFYLFTGQARFNQITGQTDVVSRLRLWLESQRDRFISLFSS
jgi:hypothetical protein